MRRRAPEQIASAHSFAFSLSALGHFAVSKTTAIPSCIFLGRPRLPQSRGHPWRSQWLGLSWVLAAGEAAMLRAGRAASATLRAAAGQQQRFMAANPDRVTATLFPGDGIGPEICESVKQVRYVPGTCGSSGKGLSYFCCQAASLCSVQAPGHFPRMVAQARCLFAASGRKANSAGCRCSRRRV